MTKEEIDQKYLDQANSLETEFFDIVKEFDTDGIEIGQHRELKEGKSETEFTRRHNDVWKNHKVELIAEGFMEPPIPPEPERDLATEIDEIKAKMADYDNLRARIEKLEQK